MAFLRALDIMEDKQGLTFSQIMYNEIVDHGLLHVMDKVSKFMEKTSEISVQGGDSLLGVLTAIAEERTQSRPELEEQSDEVRH